jgi:ABC-type branched-subunit amino acid transport system substrate-binding protein
MISHATMKPGGRHSGGRRLTLLTAACGDDDQGGSSALTRVARIAVIAPLDDGLVQFGQGIRNSVQLAVDEANRGAVS